MKRRRTNSPAFTLLELVVVLALIAVIIGITAPRFSAFASGRRIGDTADQAIILARWARTQAITRGVNFRLVFNPPQRTFQLVVQNGPSFENMQQLIGDSPQGAQGTVFDSTGEQFGHEITAADGVTFACNFPPQPDGTYYIQFRPSGRMDPGTIVFRDESGATIEVGSLTATEEFHVLNDDEQAQEKAPILPIPPAQSR